MDKINEQFQLFLNQKEIVLTTVKETHKKLMTQILPQGFSALDSSRFSRSYIEKFQTVRDRESCSTQIGNQMFNISSIKHWSLNGHRKLAILRAAIGIQK